MSQLSPTSWREVATEDLIGPLNDVEQRYAPPTLFVAGDRALLHHGARVAIVGSRQATPEGCARARKLASRLCDRGMVIVSGLAQGIDTAAHQTALDRGGRILAVLGTPLDQVYPKANAALQERIMREHLCISQFPPGAPVVYLVSTDNSNGSQSGKIVSFHHQEGGRCHGTEHPVLPTPTGCTGVELFPHPCLVA